MNAFEIGLMEDDGSRVGVENGKCVRIIPDYGSVSDALVELSEIADLDPDEQHPIADDVLCSLLLYLSKGTHHEAVVKEVVGNYYLLDKWFA